MAMMQFSVIPLTVGSSVSQHVAQALDVVDSSGLDYRLRSTCTEVEGELDQLLGVLKRSIDAVGAECDLSVMVKLDVRKQESGGALSGRIERVEKQLGRPLKK